VPARALIADKHDNSAKRCWRWSGMIEKLPTGD
jgi:hypothetical protein